MNINIDTGMHRLGISWKDIQDVSVIRSLSNLNIDGIFSHFSCASEEDPDFTRLQIKRFSTVLETLRSSGNSLKKVHFANSAAFFRYHDSHYDNNQLEDPVKIAEP